MKRCALLTCDSLEGFSANEKPLEEALKKRDWSYEWISWGKNGVNWDDFDCVIIRTTWDYTKDLNGFVARLSEIEKSKALLLNPIKLVQWNSDKKYLKQLNEQGVSIVPTQWITKFDSSAFLKTQSSNTKMVLKPQVGAGAANTFVVKSLEEKGLVDKLRNLDGKEVMVQPFMATIQTVGEFSAHFFNKKLSHTILKKPKEGDFRSQEEFGSFIKAVDLSQQDKEFCQNVLKCIPEKYLYARVDFVKDEEGKAFLMELELIEPSLYFQYDQNSAPLLVEEMESFL